MEYQFLRSNEYQDEVDRLVELQDAANNIDNFELTQEGQKQIEVKKERGRVHKKVEAATGLDFHVITKNSEKNVAALYRTDTKETKIDEKILDDEAFALYAAHHEAEHKKNQMVNLDFRSNLKPHQIVALVAALGISELDPVEVLEGFNDWITARKHGHNPRSGYVDKEVPLAQKLEQLAQENQIGSLRETFDAGDESGFYEKLGLLGDILTFKNKIQDIKIAA